MRSTNDNMFRSLDEQYNEDFKEHHCFSQLRNISIFLGQTNAEEQYELRKELVNIEKNLEGFLIEPKNEAEYREKLKAIEVQY